MESEQKYYNHMKKCCFIIPYFGHFNNYFQLFLKSCSYNDDFNWLIVTDDQTKYEYPENVKVIYQSFEDTVSFIQSKFDCPCNIARPYKFCDLKPMYGYIFEDYIKDFEFWGYCDCDIILGKLSDFITDEILSSYDKLFCLGHMTLIKNTTYNNKLFMKDIEGVFFYKNVLSSDKSFGFDEIGGDDKNINHIFEVDGRKIYNKDFSFNVNTRYPFFVQVKYQGNTFISEKYKKALYIWNNGEIYRIYKSDKHTLTQEKFMYIHLQRRKMYGAKQCLKTEIFQIMANKFIPLKKMDIDIKTFAHIPKITFCNQYFKEVLIPGIKKHLKL